MVCALGSTMWHDLTEELDGHGRFQHGIASMLRRRRVGRLQLQPEEEVRRGRRERVLQPVGVRELGRHPHDRGRLPHGRQRLAEWPLRLSPDHEVSIDMLSRACM